MTRDDIYDAIDRERTRQSQKWAAPHAPLKPSYYRQALKNLDHVDDPALFDAVEAYGTVAAT
jgi:hypothetical protein